MRTGVVNFHRPGHEHKIARYLELAARQSDEVVEIPGRVFTESNVRDYDALIFSGSAWMLAREDAPAGLRDFVSALDMPILGICFGHQLLGRSYGAPVVAGRLVDGDETIVVTEPDGLFKGMEPELLFNENHEEFLTRPAVEAAGWDVIAFSNSCEVEAMHHTLRPLHGVQFHPERSGLNGEKLFDNFYEYVVKPFARGAYRP
jgi:GMP synthase (glutamine-hydrolysing)